MLFGGTVVMAFEKVLLFSVDMSIEYIFREVTLAISRTADDLPVPGGPLMMMTLLYGRPHFL